MIQYSDEDFTEDILDIVPSAPMVLMPKIFEEALSRYRKVLDANAQSESILSSFVIIHHSETYSYRRTWGEDSTLDGGQLPAQIYYWNKFKQIASAHFGLVRGYNFVESALHDILSRHGLKGVVEFINRAWIEKMIVIDDHAWLPWWLLARCIAFGIDYSESQSEYVQAVKSTRSSQQDPEESLTNMYEVAKHIAEIDLSKGRANNKLIEYYWQVREVTELSLKEVRYADTYSGWIRGIRNLLPSYIMLNMVANEAMYCTRSIDQQTNLDQLSRFVDERKADIRTSLLQPFWLPAYVEIASGEDQRAKIRRAKFYNRGRVVFPSFVFKKIVSMLQTNSLDILSLENYIRDSISPGHIWFFNLFEDMMEKIKSEQNNSSMRT